MTMDTTRSFAKLRTDVFRLHERGEYAKALELVDREAGAFPEEASGVMYWRICLLARSGDSASALRTMEQAIGAGWWRAERILRQDPDLARLQGGVSFERFVGICRSREERAQTEARPVMRTLVPETVAPPAGYPVLIALHGFGGNVADFASSWTHLPGKGWLVVLPQASQVVDWEGYAWWDHELAGREITAYFETLCSNYRIDQSQVVLAGYSQGGVMATWLALRGLPVQARGVLGIVPGLRDPEPLAQTAKANRGGLRFYIIVGGRDFAVDRVRRFAQAFGIRRSPNESARAGRP